MGVPFDIHLPPSAQSPPSPQLVYGSSKHVPAQYLGDFQVDQMGNMHNFSFVAQALGQPFTGGSVQHQLYSAGCVNYDQRCSLSSRKISAGGGSNSISGCARIASSKSRRLGRSSARSISRSTKRDMETPSMAARTFSRR